MFAYKNAIGCSTVHWSTKHSVSISGSSEIGKGAGGTENKSGTPQKRDSDSRYFENKGKKRTLSVNSNKIKEKCE